MFPEAIEWTESQIVPGKTAQFEREVSEADVLAFATVSGDFNPLHVDTTYAEQTNFGRRIAHGAFQLSMVSALVGMSLPGRRVLLGSVRATFPAPLFYPTRVRVFGEIVTWDQDRCSGTLRCQISDLASPKITADVSVGFTLHDTKTSRPAVQRATNTTSGAQPIAASQTADKPVVLVTGAAGGLGSVLAKQLALNYSILAMKRSSSGPQFEEEIIGDLSVSGWQDSIQNALKGRPLYGIVHAAWPGFPHGSLLELPGDILREQTLFGVETTMQLCRLLVDHHGDKGGRLIAIGSVAASFRPHLSVAGYGLGKSLLENTLKLVAPELARRKITANTVCPSFISGGMNAAATERQQAREAALIPLGRLCDEDDVFGMVDYLLSDASAFVSGQVLYLTGGRI